MSTAKQMAKANAVQRQNGILFGCKNGIITFAIKWIKLEIIMLSEVSQTQTNISCFLANADSRLKFYIKYITYKFSYHMYRKGKNTVMREEGET